MAKKTDSKPKSTPDKKRKKAPPRRTRMLALEPRMLFDGALGMDIGAKATAALQGDAGAADAQAQAEATAALPVVPEQIQKAPAETKAPAEKEAIDGAKDVVDGAAPRPVQEILIIDGAVPQLEELAAAAREGVEVIILDSSRDGIEQISAILGSRTGVESVHIVSHGRPGEMTLGSTKLTLESMVARQAELEAWGEHLDEGADLLLYGCEVASDDRGTIYVEALSRITGADVAASTDNTGGWTQGGNWALEKTVGEVGSALFGDSAALSTTQILLPTTNLTAAAPWTAIFTGSNYDFAGDMQAAGGADLIGSDTHGALYMNFDDKGTGSLTDDMLGFRVRITEGGSSFSKVIFVGMDANQDGALDVFVGVDNQGGTPLIRIWDAGSSANVSPSTTSVATTGYSYAETAANYAFTAVSSTSDPNWNGTTDIDGGGSGDYFVSWQLSFADIAAFLGTQGITGVTKDTSMSFMFATSTQNNALNSDIGGVNGSTSSALTWGDLGAMSTPMSAANAAPVITSFGGQDAAVTAVVTGNTTVATLTAVDPNADTYSWSITGGADQSKFTINSSTGALTFVAAPDSSTPTDVDGDNRYQVEVSVTDSKGAVDKQMLSVDVLAAADNTAPTRTATSPADGATGVAVNSNISITFNEPIQAGSGTISIYQSNGTLAIAIPVSDTKSVTISGNTLYVDPGIALDKNTDYYVQYTAGVVKDRSGNNAAALSDTTTFNFKTANDAAGDVTAPTLSSSSPADGATGVARNAGITLTFSENVMPDTGYITIYNTTTMTAVETFAITDASRVSFSGNTVTLNPANDLDPSTAYHINIERSAVQDTAANHYLGITNATALNFTTAPNQAPVNTLPAAAQSTSEDTAKTFSTAGGNAISVADADSTFLTVTLSITNGTGTLSLASLTGINFTAGDGSADQTMTFRGTAANINAALNGLTYTPTGDYNGSTTLTIATTDGLATDTDTKTITVNAVNDAPVNTVPGAQSTSEDTAKVFSIGNGNKISVTDVDGGSLTVTLTGANGVITLATTAGLTSVSGNGSGTVTLVGTAANINTAMNGLSFAPTADFNGAASLQIATNDGTVTDTDSVAITVNAVDDAPVGVNDTATAVEAGTAAGTNPAGNVLTNDTDADSGDTKTVSAIAGGSVGGNTAGSYGTLVLNANGGYTYTVDNSNATVQALRTAGNTLTDTFTYTVRDTAGLTSTATLTVTIQGANDAPVGVNDTDAVAEEATITRNAASGVLANDTDVDSGDTKTVSAITGGTVGVAKAGTYGSLTLNADGSYSYVANNANALAAGQTATDTFTYTVSDTAGATSTASLTITLTGTNDAAVISGTVTGTVVEAGAGAGTSTASQTLTSTDVDGTANAFTAQGSTSASYGTYTMSAGGTWTYTLDNGNAAVQALGAGGTLTDTFTVAAADGTTQIITVTVQGANDAPSANAGADQTVAEGDAVSLSGSGVDPEGQGRTHTWVQVGGRAVVLSGANTASPTFTAPELDDATAIVFRLTVSDGTTAATDEVTVTVQGQPSVVVTLPAGAPAGTPAGAPAPTGPTAPPAGPAPAPTGGGMPLTQPVDESVAPSNLGGTVPAPGTPPTTTELPSPIPTGSTLTQAAAPDTAIPDLNLLPATAAGPKDLPSFPLTRMSQHEAELTRPVGTDTNLDLGANGHRLFVYQGIPDTRLAPDAVGSLSVPQDAFAHTDPAALVQLEARLASGAPLPGWLHFEGLRGAFSGTPPSDVRGALRIEVVARDQEGREARAVFVLEIEDLRAEGVDDTRVEGDALIDRAILDLLLGLEVDAKEAEKARLEAARQAIESRDPAKGKERATPQKQGAVPFGDQLRGAKAVRDPLLDRIIRGGGETPPPRR